MSRRRGWAGELQAVTARGKRLDRATVSRAIGFVWGVCCRRGGILWIRLDRSHRRAAHVASAWLAANKLSRSALGGARCLRRWVALVGGRGLLSVAVRASCRGWGPGPPRPPLS